MSTEITGRRNAESWEKQTCYDLSNGWKATVEFSVHYGDMVSRLDSPEGAYWHCSNGLDKVPDEITAADLKIIPLPDFARSWVDTTSGHNLVRPNFTKI